MLFQDSSLCKIRKFFSSIYPRKFFQKIKTIFSCPVFSDHREYLDCHCLQTNLHYGRYFFYLFSLLFFLDQTACILPSFFSNSSWKWSYGTELWDKYLVFPVMDEQRKWEIQIQRISSKRNSKPWSNFLAFHRETFLKRGEVVKKIPRGGVRRATSMEPAAEGDVEHCVLHLSAMEECYFWTKPGFG